MNWLLPFLAAGLMASCHPAHAIVVARPVVAAHPTVAAHPAPAKAAAPVSRPIPVVVPIATVRRSTQCDAQPQPADCKR